MNWAHLLPLLAFVVLPSVFTLFNYRKLKNLIAYCQKKFISYYCELRCIVRTCLQHHLFYPGNFLVPGKNWIGLKVHQPFDTVVAVLSILSWERNFISSIKKCSSTGSIFSVKFVFYQKGKSSATSSITGAGADGAFCCWLRGW
jgi:hypothetical protein